jgi:hypothetical protein
MLVEHAMTPNPMASALYVHCLADPIYRPVEIDPLATNLQIGLVNTP